MKKDKVIIIFFGIILLAGFNSGQTVFAHGVIDQVCDSVASSGLVSLASNIISQEFIPLSDNVVGVDLIFWTSLIGEDGDVRVLIQDEHGSILGQSTRFVGGEGEIISHFDFLRVPLVPLESYFITAINLDGEVWIKFNPELGVNCSGGAQNETIVDYPFATYAGNNFPSVTILEPENNDTFYEGDSVFFSGGATDKEDGELSSTIDWSSSIDDTIAIDDDSFGTTSLSPGLHIISATVTDSAGFPNTDTTSITIIDTPTTVGITPHKSVYNPNEVVTLTAHAFGISEPAEYTLRLMDSSDQLLYSETGIAPPEVDFDMSVDLGNISYDFSHGDELDFELKIRNTNGFATIFIAIPPDNESPVVTVPSDIFEYASSSHTNDGGTTVTFADPTATDNVGVTVGPTCDATSDVTLFPLGTTAVTCTAQDAAGNEGSATFDVVLTDNTPPVITLLGDPLEEIIQGQTYVDAGATASDNVDGDITGLITSGGVVDETTLGEYEITYDVTDSSFNVATQVVRTVTVITVSEGSENLEEEVEEVINSSELTNGEANSLTTKLNNIQERLNDDNPNNDKSVCGMLDAFIDDVTALKNGGSITEAEADSLIDSANVLKSGAGCS